MKILLVEDDQTLFESLSQTLQQWDFEVAGVTDFDDVMTSVEAVQPEIIIMDIKLPKFDGFHWTRKIRQNSNVPIVFLSSKDSPMDQVMSMELGADDFIQKPFNTNVLIAKIQAIYRRVYEFDSSEKSILMWQQAKLDLTKDSISDNDTEIYLSKTEMLILSMLVRNQNQIVTRDKIITALWDDEAFVSDNTLTVNVNRLRKKLADIGMNEQIETKVGRGYMAHG